MAHFWHFAILESFYDRTINTLFFTNWFADIGELENILMPLHLFLHFFFVRFYEWFECMLSPLVIQLFPSLSVTSRPKHVWCKLSTSDKRLFSKLWTIMGNDKSWSVLNKRLIWMTSTLYWYASLTVIPSGSVGYAVKFYWNYIKICFKVPLRSCYDPF